MSARPPVLEVRGLRVAFAARPAPLRALDDLSFSIGEGEVLGLVGESGAGKSLTGAAVIGLLEPPGRIVGGEIRLDGQRIDDLPEARLARLRGRRIAMVFQDPLASLDPLYSIGRQLVETIRTHFALDRRAARRYALELLEEVGIAGAERRFDHYPHQFSGGLRQRVVIALALAGRPRLLIADEPTSALDASTQAQFVALLRRLCRERGTAVLLISHDLGVIAEAADRVAVLYAGRLAEAGPVRQVIGRPRHPYSQGLMDAIPRVGAGPGFNRRAELAQIEGAMPGLGAVPAGCAFHPRCPQAVARCRRERPRPQRFGAVEVACWLPESPGEGLTDEEAADD